MDAYILLIQRQFRISKQLDLTVLKAIVMIFLTFGNPILNIDF
jgi:hypothetical protein